MKCWRFAGKWFNYGIIVVVMLLDLNMWKNQIFYQPADYGQYTGADHKVRTVVNYATLATDEIRNALIERFPEIQVSKSTVDRLVDGHGYTLKLATPRPVERNCLDVKRDRRSYAQWLQTQGTALARYYMEETNYNVWRSRSFVRTQRGVPAVRLVPSTKGANLNIMVCMSSEGLHHYSIVYNVHWATFNDFLAEA
ncbi:hypothetical protein V5799_025531 [Amblyomma americanum]|uniref:Uncharacterized protein n=1 Tax=Amblyomma americanum TaxID=6943 RepID=A0AAQ4E993_AMBAM